MNRNRTQSVHYFFRAAILLGFALYIVHLVRTDRIVYYMAPHMVIYLKISCFFLYGAAIYQTVAALRTIKRTPASCDCEHLPSRSTWRNTVFYGLFLAPLLLGFLLPDVAMSSSLAAKKGMKLSSSTTLKKTEPANNSGAESFPASSPAGSASSAPSAALPSANPSQVSDAELHQMFPYDLYNEDFAKLGMKLYRKEHIQIQDTGFVEVVSTLDMFLDNFIGKSVELTGFVYRENEMTSNQLIVSRFQIQCCSADAMPFGVMVESPDAGKFAKDTWIRVTGKVSKTRYYGSQIVKLDAEKIEITEPAKSPYVYPDYGFLQEYR